VQRTSEVHPAPKDQQLSIPDFLKIYEKHSPKEMADNIYQNRQLTSTRSGILKAEAVLRFSQVLSDFGVEYMQDIHKVFENPAFEQEIKKIPGQKSGISIQYFYMLTGDENYIKADRMISRFIVAATGKTLNIDDARKAIVEVCKQLKADYPTLTPRGLDHAIWVYQREQ
jgi:hypothetical protein